MKYSLVDLNNHLFAQLERLNNEDLKDDELSREIERSKALTSVSSQIVANGSLQLQALKVKADYQGQTGQAVKNLLPTKETDLNE